MTQTGTPLDSMSLWCSTLALQGDVLDQPREVLRQSFLAFRGRVKDLVATLGAELPGLTVHDITHLDALWRVANVIAGDDYPLNPAEAYVLGGAFLLHDAAHVLAAYPGGLAEIKQTVQWQDLIAQRYAGVDPPRGSVSEKGAMFQVLRHLHAGQAHRLPGIKWTVPVSGESLYLIENHELREYYGDLIGQLAASHHWPAEQVAAVFRQRQVACPAFLSPADWQVDALKIALLLRTADAAHLDAQRAPWFLFALRQPQGLSADHWRFQAKLGQPARTSSGELKFTSGASFAPSERAAWWLALDTARMVDRELRSAHEILREEGRVPFAASSVLGVESAVRFAKQVPVRDWEPVDVAPKVGDVTRLISSLGGAALYGDSYAAPLRELLQNGLDAVSALRSLGNADPAEGEVQVGIQPAGPDEWWLQVTDTGIGMSRFVLTNVLIDFGASLWASDAVREELPGLSKAKFKPVGKFGIGFFSVFMLGSEVRVTTRRYQPSHGESGVHWQLRFDDGLASRPALVRPSAADELPRSGTRVAVKLSGAKLKALLDNAVWRSPFDGIFKSAGEDVVDKPEARNGLLAWRVASLCPTSAVRLKTQYSDQALNLVVATNDWVNIPDDHLNRRVGCSTAPLFPLRRVDGELLGRVGIPPSMATSRYGAIVYEGVVCGRMKCLVGVVQARANNDDARRANALPAGSVAEWQAWASKVLKGDPALKLEARLRLHPLACQVDLAIWERGKVELTLRQLGEILSMKDEVLLHVDTVCHDDADDMAAHRFSDWFKPVAHLVCLPSMSPRESFWDLPEGYSTPTGRDAFPWFLDVPPINYHERFELELTAQWGAFEADEEDDQVVGDVDGIEITRSVTRYRRLSPSA